MAETQQQESGEQESPRLSKTSKWIGLFSFVCISASVVIFTIAIFRREDCLDGDQCSPILRAMLVLLATLLFFLGVSILTPLCIRIQSSTRTPQVVVSSIPAGDLEKSPAPILPNNHIPFVDIPSTDLPDYFTAVQNTGDVYLSVDAGVCSENLPPCYEQALAMATPSITSETENT